MRKLLVLTAVLGLAACGHDPNVVYGTYKAEPRFYEPPPVVYVEPPVRYAPPPPAVIYVQPPPWAPPPPVVFEFGRPVHHCWHHEGRWERCR
jgi:hypothetical protein